MSDGATLMPHRPLAPAADIKGLIDNVQPGRLFGWAWNRSDRGERLRIELRLGTEVVAETVADGERSDLVSGEIGDGRHAFDLPLTPAMLERRAEIAVVARAADGAEVPLPIRAVRRGAPVLSTVPASGDPMPPRGAQALAPVVRALSEAQARLRHEVAAVAERLPADGVAAAASLDALQARIETLELRCLTADEQLAVLRGGGEASSPMARRRLDPWQLALGLVIGLAAAGALAWSWTGVTALVLGV